MELAESVGARLQRATHRAAAGGRGCFSDGDCGAGVDWSARAGGAAHRGWRVLRDCSLSRDGKFRRSRSFFFGIAVWLRGAMRSWTETDGAPGTLVTVKAIVEALGAILSLRHLEGGGPGCTHTPEERPSGARRIHHQFVFWGFLADLVSTTLAFVYQDFLHRLPPYPLASAPVIFGSAGGVLLIVGAAGLMGMKKGSDREPRTNRRTAWTTPSWGSWS